MLALWNWILGVHCDLGIFQIIIPRHWYLDVFSNTILASRCKRLNSAPIGQRIWIWRSSPLQFYLSISCAVVQNSKWYFGRSGHTCQNCGAFIIWCMLEKMFHVWGLREFWSKVVRVSYTLLGQCPHSLLHRFPIRCLQINSQMLTAQPLSSHHGIIDSNTLQHCYREIGGQRCARSRYSSVVILL